MSAGVIPLLWTHMKVLSSARPILDILERALSTYVQSVIGLLTAANIGVSELADLSVVKTALVGAIPAGLSVLKSLSAIYAIPGDKSASLLRVGYKEVVTVVVERPVKPVARKRPTVIKGSVPPKDAA